ncbi:MAG: ribosome biogenesis GTP-binding protein YihA/YsxC [Acidobacteriota bacterium]
MKAHEVEFVAGATNLDHAPKEPLPEIAFLGPSNVGKSSLINCLLSRQGIARVSKTPGRTQQLNYFRINGRLFFVDLPGYGFAKVPPRVQQQLRKMIEGYLEGSTRLALLLLLLDSRRPPLPRDVELRAWLEESDVPHAVVLTKVDKLKRGELKKSRLRTEELLGLSGHASVLPFSSKSGVGKRELWGVIGEALSGAAGGDDAGLVETS